MIPLTIENGDADVLKLWRRFRDLSIENLEKIYGRMNIKFDEYSGESQVGEYINTSMDLLKSKQLLKESKGAVVVDLESFKLGMAMVEKGDGATLYLTRDIGEAIKRHDKHKFDKMMYVVSSAQDLHFKQLFKTLELMDQDWVKSCQHIGFGLITGMSTRKGTAVFLNDLLDEAKSRIHEIMKKNESKYATIEDPEKVADNLGTSAVIIQDFSAKRIKNYAFDWEKILALDGDSGPYLQYTHARLSSLEAKANFDASKVDIDSIQTELLDEPKALNMVFELSKFPEVVREALHAREPCTIVKYLFVIAHLTSECLEKIRVMGVEENLSVARMSLYSYFIYI